MPQTFDNAPGVNLDNASIPLTGGDKLDNAFDVVQKDGDNHVVSVSNHFNGKTLVTVTPVDGGNLNGLYLSVLGEYTVDTSGNSHNSNATQVNKTFAMVNLLDNEPFVAEMIFTKDVEIIVTVLTSTHKRIYSEDKKSVPFVESSLDKTQLTVRSYGLDQDLSLTLGGLDELTGSRQVRDDGSSAKDFQAIVTVTQTTGLRMVDGVAKQYNGDEESLQLPFVYVASYTATDISAEGDIVISHLGEAAGSTYFNEGNDKVYEVTVSYKTAYGMINGDQDTVGNQINLSTVASPSDKPHSLENLQISYTVNRDGDSPKFVLDASWTAYADEDFDVSGNTDNELQFWISIEDASMNQTSDASAVHTSSIGVAGDFSWENVLTDGAYDAAKDISTTGAVAENWYLLKTCGATETSFSMDLADSYMMAGSEVNLQGKVLNVVGFYRPAAAESREESVGKQIQRTIWHQMYTNVTYPHDNDDASERRQGVAWSYMTNLDNTGSVTVVDAVDNQGGDDSNLSTSQSLKLKATSDNVDPALAMRSQPTEFKEGALAGVLGTDFVVTAHAPTNVLPADASQNVVDINATMAIDTPSDANEDTCNVEIVSDVSGAHISLGTELEIEMHTRTERDRQDAVNMFDTTEKVTGVHTEDNGNDDDKVAQWVPGHFGSVDASDNVLSENNVGQTLTIGPYYVDPKNEFDVQLGQQLPTSANGGTRIHRNVNEDMADLTIQIPTRSFLDASGNFKMEHNVPHDDVGMGGYYFCGEESTITIQIKGTKWNLENNERIECTVDDMDNDSDNSRNISLLKVNSDGSDSNFTLSKTQAGNVSTFEFKGKELRDVVQGENNNLFEFRLHNVTVGHSYDVNVHIDISGVANTSANQMKYQWSSDASYNDLDTFVVEKYTREIANPPIPDTGILVGGSFMGMINTSNILLEDNVVDDIHWASLVDGLYEELPAVSTNKETSSTASTVTALTIKDVKVTPQVSDNNAASFKQDYLSLVQFRMVSIADDTVIASFFMGEDSRVLIGDRVMPGELSTSRPLWERFNYLNTNYVTDLSYNGVDYILTVKEENGTFNSTLSPEFVRFEYLPVLSFKGFYGVGEQSYDENNVMFGPESIMISNEYQSAGEQLLNDNTNNKYIVEADSTNLLTRTVSRPASIVNYDVITERINETNHNVTVNVNLSENDISYNAVSGKEVYYDQVTEQVLDYITISLYTAEGSSAAQAVSLKVTNDSGFAADKTLGDDETKTHLTYTFVGVTSMHHIGVTASYDVNNTLNTYLSLGEEIHSKAFNVAGSEIASVPVVDDVLSSATNDVSLNELEFTVDLNLDTDEYVLSMPNQVSSLADNEIVMKLYVCDKDASHGLNALYTRNVERTVTGDFGASFNYKVSTLQFNTNNLESNFTTTLGYRLPTEALAGDRNEVYNMLFNVASKDSNEDILDSVRASLSFNNMQPNVSYNAYAYSETETLLMPVLSKNEKYAGEMDFSGVEVTVTDGTHTVVTKAVNEILFPAALNGTELTITSRYTMAQALPQMGPEYVASTKQVLYTVTKAPVTMTASVSAAPVLMHSGNELSQISAGLTSIQNVSSNSLVIVNGAQSECNVHVVEVDNPLDGAQRTVSTSVVNKNSNSADVFDHMATGKYYQITLEGAYGTSAYIVKAV